MPVDSDEELDEGPERPDAERPVGDRRGQDAQPPDEIGLAQEPIAEPRPVAGLQLGAGAVVHLGDLHVRRAGHRAHAAAGAPVDGRVGGRDVRDGSALGRQQRREPESLGLRPDVLRAREQVRDAGDRADGVADVALEAVLGRQADLERRRLGDEVLDRHRDVGPAAAASRGTSVALPGGPVRGRATQRSTPAILGRPDPAGDRDAVAAPFLEVAHPGQHAARDRDVVEHDLARRIDGPERGVRPDPGPLQRMPVRRERRRCQPVVDGRCLHRQAEDGLDEAPVGVPDQPAARDPAGRQHDAAGPDRAHPRRRPRRHGRHPAPVPRHRLDRLADRDPATLRPQRRPERLEQSQPGKARRNERDLERRQLDGRRKLRERRGVVPVADRRREADPSGTVPGPLEGRGNRVDRLAPRRRGRRTARQWSAPSRCGDRRGPAARSPATRRAPAAGRVHRPLPRRVPRRRAE